MSITINCTPRLPIGRVIFVRDGMVVADAMLDDLITVDEDDTMHSDIDLIHEVKSCGPDRRTPAPSHRRLVRHAPASGARR